MSKRLGELLVRQNLIKPDDLQRAREDQQRNGGRLGEALVRLKYLKEEDIVAMLGRQYGLPPVDLDNYDVDTDVIRLISEEQVHKYHIIPINRVGSTLIIAVDDPSNMVAIDDIKFLTGYNVEAVLASSSAIKRAIDKYYDQSASLMDMMTDFSIDDLQVVEEEDDDRSQGSRKGRRRRPRRQAGQHDPHQRDQGGRQRHPCRALREELPRALPHRRRPVREDEAADEAQGRHHQPPEDHGGARHRRASPPPGRPHQAQGRQRQGHGLPRLGPADALRRKDRPAAARQVQPAARHDQARVRGTGAQGLQGGHLQALTAWCSSRGPRAPARPPRSTPPSPS